MIAEALAFVSAAAAAAAVAEGLASGARRARDRRAFTFLSAGGRRFTPARGGALAPIERRLAAAGRPGGIGARDFLAAKLGAALAAAAAGTLAGAVLPGRLALLAAVAAPVGGFLAPDVWLARRRAEWVAGVRRDLPALLDLLQVTVAAGLSLPESLAEVGRRSHAPLAGRWRGIAAQVAVGLSLPAALEAHRRELALPEVDALTGALARAHRHGVPLSDTLAAQARDARLARRRAVQEQAARAGPKMQLVVALLLVPAVMLLVAAGLVSALAGGAGEMLTGF